MTSPLKSINEKCMQVQTPSKKNHDKKDFCIEQIMPQIQPKHRKKGKKPKKY